MAAGEYVSVSSQADTERADLERNVASWPRRAGRRAELTGIYVKRGWTRPWHRSRTSSWRTMRSPLTPATSWAFRNHRCPAFAGRAPRPRASPSGLHSPSRSWRSLRGIGWYLDRRRVAALAGSAGSLGRTDRGASVATGAMRVTFWGALAMGATAAAGALFGAGQ